MKATRILLKPSRKTWIITVSVLFLLLVCGLWVYKYITEEYNGETRWIYVDAGYSNAELRDMIISELGSGYGDKVYLLWNLQGGDVMQSVGAYKVEPGVEACGLSRILIEGVQSPVTVTFNNVRTMEQLAKRVSKNMRFDETDFLRACDSVLSREGFASEEYPAAFFPDSYEFYWTAMPHTVVEKLLRYYRKYWTDEKVAKAKSMGLTPVEVSIVASIVEEETNKTDERPKVARLYLNRIKKEMKLQADPTVKFALGDFSIRRLLNEHLTVESLYNTYRHEGLPPGPIRIVNKRTLDAVLDAPQHDYIYMCAKEDFSGYHNFAVDYATHMANARRYQAELNRRKIMR